MKTKYYLVTLSASENYRLLRQPFLIAKVLVELREAMMGTPEEERSLVQESAMQSLAAKYGSNEVQACNYLDTEEMITPSFATEPTTLHNGLRTWIIAADKKREIRR